MTMNPKPGNEPGSSDMSIEQDLDAEVRKPTDPNLAEEEEAAKLGDFA